MSEIMLGTCSWNYDSWRDLVYTKTRKHAAEYLEEYAQRFSTVEIDSWFYKIPTTLEAREYAENVGPDFKFTAKVFQGISLTHQRQYGKASAEVANPDFLSVELFKRFVESIEPILPKTACLMLEFEYLNAQKMPSLDAFIEKLDAFIQRVDRAIPLGLEVRNKNYLCDKYFDFLDRNHIIQVFSEKQYMPSVAAIHDQFKRYFKRSAIFRLLGGDRQAIETRTGNTWNQIVDEKTDTDQIARVSIDRKRDGLRTIINVNNHYEGSAPLTIRRLEGLIAG